MKIEDYKFVKEGITFDGVPDDCIFCSVLEAPFRLYGLKAPEGDTPYHRMPLSVAKEVSQGVFNLTTHTAGGRLRFVTDSPFITLHAAETNISYFPHMPATGASGFDICEDTAEGPVYISTFVPPRDIKDSFTSTVYFPTDGTHSVTLNFPLYSGVSEVLIGLKKNSVLEEAKPYKHEEKPVVFYGSSITQGGCAAHPCGCYQAFLSQGLSFDYINLGFSGNCKAEKRMCEYISGLDMSVFVYDYDHNAPDADYLEATHEPFFKAFRASQPDTPVIFMSRPKPHLTPDEIRRRDIINKTYSNAVEAGDKNVYFADCSKIFEPIFGEGIYTDSVHPNNLGFMYMAKALMPILDKLLNEA